MTGKDIIVVLSQNSVAVASTCIRSQDIQTQADLIEVASASQQSWREYIAGRKGWSLTVNYLVLAAAQLSDLLLTGQVFDVTLKDVGNTTSLTGTAIMVTAKQTAMVGNLCQGTFQLQGTGALA